MAALISRRPPRLEPQIYEATAPIFNTPAIACALAGQEATTLELMRAGVSCRGTNFLGWQALHHAAHWGWSGLVALLLRTDARVDIDALIVPPLLVAGALNKVGAQVLVSSVLHDNGPKQTLVLKCLGGTVLHCAVAGGQWLCARMLLEAGANPTKRSLIGQTPLDLALALGFADLAALLRDAVAARRRVDRDSLASGTGSNAGWRRR
jgi:ankyrin repeat protein